VRRRGQLAEVPRTAIQPQTQHHPSLTRIATAFAVGGVVGWLIENALYGSRNSYAFDKAPIPFLPVYGVGTATVVETASYIQDLPFLVRGMVYGVELSGIELAACQIDRSFGPPSWDYGNGKCIDLPHTILWGVLGLLVEQIAGQVQ
jgi:hypothetical protein